MLRSGFAVLLLLAAAACNSDQDVRRILRPPEAAITTPYAEQAFRQGVGPLLFSGTVSDSFDGPSHLHAAWSIDGGDPTKVDVERDGTVILSFDADPLELGEHLAALSVTDRDHQEAEVEVPWVLLGALSAPVVTITAPGDGAEFAPGDEIAFRGSAVDNNTAPGDLAFSWASSLDGPIDGAISGDGQSVVFDSALSLGTHTISLQAVDVDGEIGVATVAVTIAEPTEPTEPTTTTPTDPTTTVPTVAEVGDLVFSELMVNPEAVEDEVGEWVELYNTAGSPIDLAGYSFHDLGIDAYTLGSVLIAPNDYVVLCASMDPAINGGVVCDAPFVRATGGLGAMALGNSGDEVVLSRPDGLVIDQVIYDDTWFTPATATGLDPTQLSADNNDDETMWCNETTTLAGELEPGTPGLPNDPC